MTYRSRNRTLGIRKVFTLHVIALLGTMSSEDVLLMDKKKKTFQAFHQFMKCTLILKQVYLCYLVQHLLKKVRERSNAQSVACPVFYSLN